MSSFGIELSFNNHAESFVLPVNPSSIDIKEGQNSKTYTTEGLGEINVIKAPKLTEVSFESEFPAKHYPYVTVKDSYLLKPIEYLAYIKRWMAAKHPIRFIAISPDYSINLPMSIESFEWKESAGEEGDIQYSISLKEYVFYAARKVTVTQDANGQQVIIKHPPKRPDERVRPETYTLKPGDNLWIVARRVLGDDSRWREIQKLNGLTDAQLKKLPVGLVVKIPKD